MADITGLSVRVSAQVQSFLRGVSRAEEQAQDLALSLTRLSFASERAEDDLDSVGRSAAAASGGMATFGISTEGAGFAVRGLSASILVSLIPALTALTAALAPVVGALGGFVAIAGSIGAVGLLPAIGAIATNTEDLKVQFEGLLDTIRSEFAPVFDTAAEVLVFFIQRLEDTIPALVPTDEQIRRLAGNFAALGAAVIDALPAFVELATTLATEFLPPFVTFVQDVLPETPGMIRDLVGTFERLLPSLIRAGRLFVRLLPPLTEFGFTVLQVLGPALAGFTVALTNTLEAVNNLDPSLRRLVAAGSLLAPIITALISHVGGLSAPVLAAVGAVAGLALAFQRNFAGVRDAVMNVVSTAQRMLGNRAPTIISNFQQAFETILPVIRPVISALVDLLEVGLINAVDIGLGALVALSELLTGDFQAAFEAIAAPIGRSVGRIAALLDGFINGVLQTFVEAFVARLNSLGLRLETFANNLGVSFDFQMLEAPDLSEFAINDPTDQPGQGERRDDRARRDGPMTVNVEVQGDTGVVEDVAATVVDQEQRRTRRNQGRRGTPN